MLAVNVPRGPAAKVARGPSHPQADSNQLQGPAHVDLEVEAEAVNAVAGKPKVCGRCSQKGHETAECTIEVHCYICDGHDHVNYRCPVLKLPKPVANAVGVLSGGAWIIPYSSCSVVDVKGFQDCTGNNCWWNYFSRAVCSSTSENSAS